MGFVFLKKGEKELVTLEEVKRDLKSLKHLEYSIRAFGVACENLQKQYDFYKNAGGVSEDVERLRVAIKNLKISELIKSSIAKKEKYFEAIAFLEPINRTIIVDSVINGCTYWQIGKKLGYSDEAIKKRVNKAIKQIAEFVNKGEKMDGIEC